MVKFRVRVTVMVKTLILTLTMWSEIVIPVTNGRQNFNEMRSEMSQTSKLKSISSINEGPFII